MSNIPSLDSQKIQAKKILTRIAVGLVEQQEKITKRNASPITSSNEHIKSGLEQLSVLCITHKSMPPLHHKEVVNWLHQPVEDWPGVGQLMADANLFGSLLFLGQPTDLAYELSERMLSGNPEIEIQDIPFKDILEYCSENKLDEQYIRARLFLVQNPYLEWGTKIINSDLDWEPEIRSLLCATYERIPLNCRVKQNGVEQIALCPRCGWTLEWQGSSRHRAVCYSDLCSRLVSDINTPQQWIPYRPESMRTIRGIQASVVAPERSLIQLINTLVNLGLDCSLWPSIDNYDLMIKFPNGKVWAVDMKDQANARELAWSLKPLKQFPAWDKAFYIFPDYRYKGKYKKVFQAVWDVRCQENSALRDIGIFSVKQFVGQVKNFKSSKE
ncbi:MULTISPECIES: restriction endonuclease-related protein [Nostocaceae]|jgi:hypothetical protein|uniref:REase associating with pPIWI RE domain-containing protein n=2 Tax=Nostocaceae TaxID=1162 RepID=A0A3S1A6V6_ANAVA|nr:MULTISPECIES: hypothetical protein [Nostocaceae]MBD2568810.1 hypothetical protein [Anabaena lutea FACHB-196]MBD2628979.1 hypothetical protein [Trichormus variabilis FACHB-164]RUS94520.1 hypothetical protein DSM107003_36490 [Trichormus variabilis SAG 1403-4b]